MIITPLWHTEFLVDIKNSEDQNVRILVDAWLSEFAIWDLMERSVKVRLDREKLSTIDAIYISHSHTDHFDPYTLVEIYWLCHSEEWSDPGKQKEISHNDENKKPLLLLPFTLEYLVPLIREYLWDIPLEILYPGKSFSLKNITITGHVFPQSTITNEDDVMMIAIESDRELLFAEIDTLPEDDDEEVQNSLYRILTRKDYETVCYLASRNELEWQLPLLDTPVKKRKPFRSEYIAGRKDAMYAAYQKYEYEDFAGFENIYTIPNLLRGFIGQGIGYPSALSEDLARTQIFPLEEITSMESDIARECGYEFPQRALLSGRQYKAEFGTLEPGRKECPIGTLELSHEKWDIETTDVRLYASGPLFPRVLEVDTIEQEKKRILEILNIRFLPYWSASPVAPLRDALMKNGGTYRILLRSLPLVGGVGGGTPLYPSQPPLNGEELDSYDRRNSETIIFEYSTSRTWFIEVPYTSDMQIDEEYWLLDVVDFLDGRQELYSNFWHRLDSKRIYRLWTCLGANFCNNDLVIKKYRLHFERASRGETSESFFEEMKKSFAK